MRPALAQREIALAGLALLAAVISLAVTRQSRDGTGTSPQPEGSYTALAGSSGPAAFGRRTACGGVIHPDTQGVSHPTLPCGARIFLSFHGMRVLTQVVDRGPYVPGRQFDLTDALARRVGLRGVQRIHWSYARAG
jgi:rare lipoprotein A